MFVDYQRKCAVTFMMIALVRLTSLKELLLCYYIASAMRYSRQDLGAERQACPAGHLQQAAAPRPEQPIPRLLIQTARGLQ